MLQSYQSVSCWLICQRVPFWPKQCCTVCNFAGPCKEYAEQTVVDGQDKVNKLRLCKDSHCDVHVWHVWHTCPLSEMKWDSWPVCPSHGISHYLDLFSHACVSRILWSNSTGALRKWRQRLLWPQTKSRSQQSGSRLEGLSKHNNVIMWYNNDTMSYITMFMKNTHTHTKLNLLNPITNNHK